MSGPMWTAIGVASCPLCGRKALALSAMWSTHWTCPCTLCTAAGAICLQRKSVILSGTFARAGFPSCQAGPWALSTAFSIRSVESLLNSGEYPSLKDWENHLTTIFPEVRLKRYMEMRGADGGPWRIICALSAFWIGLLYHRYAPFAVYNVYLIRPLADICLALAMQGFADRSLQHHQRLDAGGA